LVAWAGSVQRNKQATKSIVSDSRKYF
jgi:hypothetical protein